MLFPELMTTDLFLCSLDLTRSVSLIFSLAPLSELGGYTEDVTLALLKQSTLLQIF